MSRSIFLIKSYLNLARCQANFIDLQSREDFAVMIAVTFVVIWNVLEWIMHTLLSPLLDFCSIQLKQAFTLVLNSAPSFYPHHLNLIQPYLFSFFLPSSHPSLLLSLSSVYGCTIITLHLWLSGVKQSPLSSSPSHHLYLSFTLSFLNDRDMQ